MEEQNKFFCEEMIAMAREGHDGEDGWTKLSRVEPEGIDVFERKVSWSQASHLRSRWTASCGVEKVGEFFLTGQSDKSVLFDSESYSISNNLLKEEKVPTNVHLQMRAAKGCSRSGGRGLMLTSSCTRPEASASD